MTLESEADMATQFTQAQLHGVPAIEIEVVSEVLNGADYDQQTTFGDLINGAIVRNFKAEADGIGVDELIEKLV